MTSKLSLIWNTRSIDIEYAWVGVSAPDAPVMVLLHEGLGSVAMWKDFPDTLCQRLNMRGLVYSRPGYGASTPRAIDEHWDGEFMHRQATDILPALLQALNIKRPWLFGHSDGGSIALLFAAHFPDVLAGAIVIAPHVFVEEISVASIRIAREAYLQHGLREKLARYHADVDSAFFGWNDVWLSPAFRSWDITPQLTAIRCPLLAVQGKQDEYGTMRQVHEIRNQCPQTQVLELDDCGHSPHRDQQARLISSVEDFVRLA
ncbi:MAG: alpha/beta hydrolase, partial [Burkholderiaceae bacterium]|nr:alpha/beta hydrolase [Burkholderiaceae bacterium]